MFSVMRQVNSLNYISRGGDSLIKVCKDVRARVLGILGVNFCPGIRFSLIFDKKMCNIL